MISWFPVPDEEDLDSRVAELVTRQRKKPGFYELISNYAEVNGLRM